MAVRDLELEAKGEYSWTCPVVMVKKLRAEARERKDTDLENLLWRKMYNAETAKEDLIKKVDNLRHRMHRLAVSLESQCPSVNSLGEVRDQGVDIDIACAIFHRECELLDKWLVESWPDRMKGHFSRD